MEFVVSVRLPDHLVSKIENAASSLKMTPEQYVRIAVEEKLRRLPDDLEREQRFNALAEHTLDKNQEVYRRLAEWPEK
jgi:predicted DNA-binding protein